MYFISYFNFFKSFNKILRKNLFNLNKRYAISNKKQIYVKIFCFSFSIHVCIESEGKRHLNFIAIHFFLSKLRKLPLMLQQVSADPCQQQMGKHLAWYAEQRYSSVVVAVLTVPFPLPDRDDQPLLPVRGNGT